MYDDLVKRLRRCEQFKCRECEYEKLNGCRTKLNEEAANAIEELEKESEKLRSDLGTTIRELTKHRWIPVTERLPKGADKSGELCENVWLFFDDGNVYPGWMNGITEKVYYLDEYSDSCLLYNVMNLIP